MKLYCIMSTGMYGPEPLFDSKTGWPWIYASKERAQAEVDLLNAETEGGYFVTEGVVCE